MHSYIKIIALALILLSFGCTPVLYGPDSNRLSTPKEKDDINFSAGLAMTPRFINLSFEASYSPMNNLGTQLFFNFSDKFRSYGLGIGIYNSKVTKEHNKVKKSTVFDLYGAYTFVNSIGQINEGSSSLFGTNEYRYDFRFHDFSIQGGMHFYLNNVGVDLAYRPHLINIISADVFGETNIETRESIQKLDLGPFVVHDILGRLCFGKNGFNIYLGTSISISPQVIETLNDPITLTTGLALNLNEIIKL